MAASESLTLTIPQHFADELREAVAAGEYASADDALADALSTWARRKEDREEGMAEIRAMVAASIHDPRPSLSLDEVDAHLDALFRNVEASRNNEAA